MCYKIHNSIPSPTTTTTTTWAFLGPAASPQVKKREKAVTLEMACGLKGGKETRTEVSYFLARKGARRTVLWGPLENYSAHLGFFGSVFAQNVFPQCCAYTCGSFSFVRLHLIISHGNCAEIEEGPKNQQHQEISTIAKVGKLSESSNVEPSVPEGERERPDKMEKDEDGQIGSLRETIPPPRPVFFFWSVRG